MLRRVGLSIVLLGAALSVVWSAIAAPRVLPRLRVAPGFALTASDGAIVSSDQLRGQVLVVVFAPSTCASSCGPLLQLAADAVERARDGTTDIRPIWLVTDPVDTATLAYLADQAPASGTWVVLGDSRSEDLDRILDAFRVPRRVAGDRAVVDPALVIVDPLGIVRAEYRSLPEAGVLAGDLDALTREIRNSRGLRRYLYEAAHLFTCSAEGV